jgi:FMN phosphatase YigB (HAD superfamily)
MIEALLLDLDGTLLDNDIQAFLQVYLGRLSRAMAPWVAPEVLVPQLLRSTNVMLANQDPARTLREAFAADFYPALGTTEAGLVGRFEDFYRDEFPRLREHTAQRPAAAALVSAALGSGLRLAVATNPLFPRMAIDHRLAWAGVPSDRFAYDVVTSYESFHSAKPQLAYYAEILGHLGVSASRAAMVGDSPSDDLAPARALGMAAFHVSDSPDPDYPGGTLDQVIGWLGSAEALTDHDAEHAPAGVMARLHGQLGTLLTRFGELSEEAWRAPATADRWTPVEVVCHLRDLEAEVHLPRLQLMLQTQAAFLPAVDSDRWVEARGYAHQSGPQALGTYVELRKETLARLAALSPEDWDRRATHALLGPASLPDVMSLAADHELIHLAALAAPRAPTSPDGSPTHR